MVHKIYGGDYLMQERLAVMGKSQGRLFLFIMDLYEESYNIIKAVYIGKAEDYAIHSIVNMGSAIYLIDSYNNKIYEYDTDLNNFNETNVGSDPRHAVLAENSMYVTNFESDNISVIDLCNFTLTESIPSGIKPHDVLYNTFSKKLYACCYEENEIIEYSKDKEQKKHLKTVGKPMHMFLNDDYIIVMTYAVNGSVHTNINFINIYSGIIEKIITIDGLGTEFDFDDEMNRAYLLNIVDKNLYIIDARRKEFVNKIFLGGYPEGLSAGEQSIYVSNSKKNQITIIDKFDHSVIRGMDLTFVPGCLKIIKQNP